jgi:hypothetical protein
VFKSNVKKKNKKVKRYCEPRHRRCIEEQFSPDVLGKVQCERCKGEETVTRRRCVSNVYGTSLWSHLQAHSSDIEGVEKNPFQIHVSVARWQGEEEVEVIE